MPPSRKKAGDSRAEARKQAFTKEQFDEIQTEAYYLWQKRGCPHGSAWIDWFMAQEKLLAAQEA